MLLIIYICCNPLELYLQVYYSEHTVMMPLAAIEGKCEVRRKQDLPFIDAPAIFQHTFFCEYFYDHKNGAVKQVAIPCPWCGTDVPLPCNLFFSLYVRLNIETGSLMMSDHIFICYISQ